MLRTRRNSVTALLVLGTIVCLCSQIAVASPFGQGNFGTQIPFSAQTSISIALSGNVNLSLTPSGSNYSATSSNTVTVTSTDAEGYSLYMYSNGSTALSGGVGSIPASSNVSEAALSTGTWGYNTDGSTNYIGLTTTPTIIVNATGPYESGNTTTVNYGILVPSTANAGTYNGTVTFTAVALND